MGIIIQNGIQYGNQPDISGKVDKVTGKGLSTEDYTTEEKAKLQGIASGAQVNSITGVKGNAESTYRTGDVNLTAANVGALALSGGTITGDINIKKNDVDASKADNGVSSALYPKTIKISDSSNRILTSFESGIYPSGRITSYWFVRNYNTDGSIAGERGIKLQIDKDGSFKYIVDDPDKFRSAIGVDAAPCLVVNCGTLSSLPTTISNAAITADMVVVSADVGNPAAQGANDWQAVCVDGAVTISGTIAGTTALTLYLMKSRTT